MLVLEDAPEIQRTNLVIAEDEAHHHKFKLKVEVGTYLLNVNF